MKDKAAGLLYRAKLKITNENVYTALCFFEGKKGGEYTDAEQFARKGDSRRNLRVASPS